MPWFAAIARPEDRPLGPDGNPIMWALTIEQRIIKFRSYGIGDAQPTWRFIGRMMERCDVTVRRWYDVGIDRAWKAARSWQPERAR